MVLPPTTVSSVAVRMKCFTGVVQRIASSTNSGISDGSAFSLASSAGLRASSQKPPAADELVVSCPAVAVIT